MLVDNKYKFVIEKDTVIFVNYKEAEKGNVHIGLYKDSVVASNGIDFEYIIDSFILKIKRREKDIPKELALGVLNETIK